MIDHYQAGYSPISGWTLLGPKDKETRELGKHQWVDFVLASEYRKMEEEVRGFYREISEAGMSIEHETLLISKASMEDRFPWLKGGPNGDAT